MALKVYYENNNRLSADAAMREWFVRHISLYSSEYVRGLKPLWELTKNTAPKTKILGGMSCFYLTFF